MNIVVLGGDFTTANVGGPVIRKRNLVHLAQNADTLTFFSLQHTGGRLCRFFSLLRGRDYGYRKEIDKEVLSYIRENQVSLLFIDGFSLKTVSFEKIRKLSPSTVIMVFFHNLESDFFAQYITSMPLFIRRQIHKFVTLRKIQKTEGYYCRKADCLITLNERDSDSLYAHYGRKADFIWPTSFQDVFPSVRPSYTEQNYLLFLGSDFYGNTEGLFWFIKNCMNRISLPLKVVGYGMEKYAAEWNSEAVEFTGYVDDLSACISDASAIVLPILSGSGMKTKTCECLMYGKKIFGSREAFEGYEGISETGCVCCDSADDFVSAINSFAEEIAQKKEAAESYKFLPQVRSYFLQNYEQTVQAERFAAFLRESVQKKKPSAVFCLLARDCEKNGARNIAVIENYRAQFSKSAVIVIENDSVDATKKILQNWKEKSCGIIVKSEDHPQWAQLDRVERIARCRNEYMEILRSLPDTYDYVIVLDMDVLLQDLDFEKIISRAPADFSALAANGRYYFEFLGKNIPLKYYDLYAYVPYKSPLVEFKQSELHRNGDRLERLLRKKRYLPCDSAFGGLVLYRYPAVRDLSYRLVENKRSTFFSTICEHVLFSKDCAKKGTVYIAKDMPLLYEKVSGKLLFLMILQLLITTPRMEKLLNIYFRFFKRKYYGPQKD